MTKKLIAILMLVSLFANTMLANGKNNTFFEKNSAQPKVKQQVAAKLKDAADIAFYETNYDSAILNYEKALKIYQDLKQNENIFYCYNQLASSNQHLYNTPDAVKYYEKAFDLYARKTDKSNAVKVMDNIATAYLLQGKYNTAYAYLKDALFLASGLPENEKTSIYLHMGNVYANQSNEKDAFEYYNKALAIAQKCEDTQNLDEYYLSLAKFYEKKDPDTAIIYVNKLSTTSDDTLNNDLAPVGYNILATAHYYKNNFKEAKKYLNDAIFWSKQQNNLKTLAASYSTKGMIFLSNQNTPQAKIYFDTAYAIAKKNKLYPELLTVYRNYQMMYVATKDFIKAEKYLDTLELIHKKILIDTAFTTNLISEYFENQKNEEVTEQISKVKIIVYSTGILAVIILPFVIIKKIRKRKKVDNEKEN